MMRQMDIEKILFEVAALIGRTEIPMAVYLGLQVGDILLLDKNVGEPLTVEVGEEIRFSGRPGLSEVRKAIRINERIHSRRN